MTINESFFGQYSVFCVFGSVVGCVVVPLIAQVLQQQSMECMILSAIVISLTAAHLNKKGHENSNSKIIFTKELEKKKINHNNNTKKQKNHTHASQHHNNQHNEQVYVEQHKHLKIIEMERKVEEKRLKKIRKREERLKKREEENKKQLELEERYQKIKEKRLKQQKENFVRPYKKYLNSSIANLEKYCESGCTYAKPTYNKSTMGRYKQKHDHNNTCQHIPRFERQYTSPMDTVSPLHQISDNLTVKCPNLSVSCSSLSSISSSDSSTSPPLPTLPNNTGAWKVPAVNQVQNNVLSTQNLWPRSNRVSSNPNTVLKSYTNVRPTKGKTSYGFDSSSLFCTRPDELKKSGTLNDKKDDQSCIGEYSLFGPQQFGKTFVKAPTM